MLAQDRSTLTGTGKSTVERFLRLQEAALQSERTARALGTLRVVSRTAKNFADRILLWNEVSLDTNALDYVPPLVVGAPYHQEFGPHKSSRAMAVVQLAVFEVVNAHYGHYQSYSGFTAASGGWSPDAAVAQAAHDALVALYPPQTADLDSILASDLIRIPATPLEIANGRAAGAAACVSVKTKLGADNTTLPEPSIPADYQPSHAIGEWDVDPISKIMVALGGELAAGHAAHVQQSGPVPRPAASPGWQRRLQYGVSGGQNAGRGPAAGHGDHTLQRPDLHG